MMLLIKHSRKKCQVRSGLAYKDLMSVYSCYGKEGVIVILFLSRPPSCSPSGPSHHESLALVEFQLSLPPVFCIGQRFSLFTIVEHATRKPLIGMDMCAHVVLRDFMMSQTHKGRKTLLIFLVFPLVKVRESLCSLRCRCLL